MSTHRRHPQHWKRVVAATSSIALGATLAAGTAIANAAEIGEEPYRPGVHFSPEKNWMNDPNGMVYYDGLYHLFFQHNPYGNDWGNMSWGHATSPDLMRWTQHPVAIPQTLNEAGQSIEDIFSGSVVVDWDNTSGLAPEGAKHPPLVALYTSAYTGLHPKYPGLQAQSLAYSLDGGMTWEKYENNPVLNRDSREFRDPKVFWYDDGPDNSYWVMVAVEATSYQVLLYKSDNLIDWYGSDPENPLVPLSTFGPANAVGGIWECPDLFKVDVVDDAGKPTGEEKWVMVVNLNPGAIGGGSGGQYFVGDFDGIEFTSESTISEEVQPTGDLAVAGGDFEGTSWAPWTVVNGGPDNGPFGLKPADGALPGQSPVTGFLGKGLVNSFVGGDGPKGTLESPEFAIDSDYLTFLVGGGRHPHVEDGQMNNEPPAGQLMWNGFEPPEGQTTSDLETDYGWTLTGDFTGSRNPSNVRESNQIGDWIINTWHGGPNGDQNIGTMTSPEFDVTGDYLNMLLAGGRRADGSLEVQLLVNGQVVRTLTGTNSGSFNWQHMNISEFKGQKVQFRVWDYADTGSFPQIWVDHVVMSDVPAQPVSDETTVNLIVDGKVVRSATGNDSETLEWTSWDVRQFAGKNATVKIIDNNGGGWGHILVDEILKTKEPAPNIMEKYLWLDWGRDYYAAVSYSGVPDGRHIMQGWMNNWQYAGDTPTSPWRSAMTLPREVTLVETGERDGEPTYALSQRVVEEFDNYLEVDDAFYTSGAMTLPAGKHTFPGVEGDMFQLDLTLEPGTSSKAGVVIRASEGFDVDPAKSAPGAQGTIVGYDSDSGRVYVDRTRSGNVGFSGAFPSVSSFPMSPDKDGRISLRLYVDRASVEVLTGSGVNSITDIFFPDASSTGLFAFVEGGTATLVEASFTPVNPSMFLGGIVVDTEDPTLSADGVLSVPVVMGVDYTVDVDGAVVAPDAEGNVALLPGQTAKVTATARVGYTLAEDAVTEWSFTFVKAVSPEAPTLSDANVLTIPRSEGVNYRVRVDGRLVVVVGPTMQLRPGQVAVVEAIPRGGYKIADGADSQWEFTANENPDPKPELNVRRWFGSNRYQTNLVVNENLITKDGSPMAGKPLFVATGASFADALSISPAVAKLEGSLVLTAKSTMAADLVALIESNKPSAVYVVGGKNAVSDAVLNQVGAAAGVDPERIFGATRYATSEAIFAEFFADANVDGIFVATGRAYPDALSASAAGGALGMPVVLVDGVLGTSLPTSVIDGVGSKFAIIVGGSKAVNDNVEVNLISQGFSVQRAFGTTRYDTNLKVNELVNAKAPAPTGVWVATGANFPDALSASVPAGNPDQRLVLSNGTCIPKPVVSEWIDGHDSKIKTVTLVGGTNALKPSVEALTECK